MNIAPEALRQAFLEACEAELRAFKPGNVSVYSEGHDMTVEDFRRSAQASAPPLCDPALGLGEKVYHAVKATRQAVGCNTNLGILLLAAPLIHACQTGGAGKSLRENLEHVLTNTTREDADWVYQAIRLAEPGGLGESESQDIHSTPEVTLTQAMGIAAHRDQIACAYVNSFSIVFDLAIPRYDKGMSVWGDEEWATVAVFAALLIAIPDSHIERKFGTRFNRYLADKLSQVEQALSASAKPEEVLPLLRNLDAELKSQGLNPGTSADLTVACLLSVRLERLIKACGQCG